MSPLPWIRGPVVLALAALRLLMRTVVYNPLAAANPENICTVFAAADVVLLTGMASRRRKDEEVHGAETGNHRWWAWGRDGGDRSSEAA